MLTKAILYGMNILTLAGFLLMGIGLTLQRHKTLGTPVILALMGMGTALVFFGIYVAAPAQP